MSCRARPIETHGLTGLADFNKMANQLSLVATADAAKTIIAWPLICKFQLAGLSLLLSPDGWSSRPAARDAAVANSSHLSRRRAVSMAALPAALTLGMRNLNRNGLPTRGARSGGGSGGDSERRLNGITLLLAAGEQEGVCCWLAGWLAGGKEQLAARSWAANVRNA